MSALKALAPISVNGFATVHVRLAGAPAPAALRPCTSKKCDPTLRLVYVFGDVHVVNEPPSRAHRNELADGLALNVKVALVDVTLPEGPPVIEVVGGGSAVGSYPAQSSVTTTGGLSLT
jgi:hypothetical protein